MKIFIQQILSLIAIGIFIAIAVCGEFALMVSEFLSRHFQNCFLPIVVFVAVFFAARFAAKELK